MESCVQAATSGLQDPDTAQVAVPWQTLSNIGRRWKSVPYTVGDMLSPHSSNSWAARSAAHLRYSSHCWRRMPCCRASGAVSASGVNSNSSHSARNASATTSHAASAADAIRERPRCRAVPSSASDTSLGGPVSAAANLHASSVHEHKDRQDINRHARSIDQGGFDMSSFSGAAQQPRCVPTYGAICQSDS